MKNSTIYKSKKGFKYEVFEAIETDYGYSAGMEVTSPTGDWVAEIGLLFDKKRRLFDYDGVTYLNPNNIKAIRNAGFIVPREFESL